MDKAAVRVLLVDDDEDERVIVSDLLRAAYTETFDLSWVPTYEKGLEAIQQGRCDVCLVDYRIGERSGLDLLAEVAAKPGHAQVILMTGEGDRGVDVTAAKAGAADYLVKGELTAALLERSIRYALERGRTLQALRDTSKLQSLNLAKSAFLAAMSHEMRTPMNAILGMTEMLCESPLSTEQKGYVEVLRRTGSGLLVLINDILDLSTIESGHLDLKRVAFDLGEVVDQAIELIAGNARSKGLLVFAHLSPDVAPTLMGDPGRLRQILVNLLGNAVKFTPSGEVVLTVRNHVSGKSGQIDFVISDTGIGIAPDKLETIFDDFTQADTSTTRKYGGTGLGLGISRRIVEAMGGVLTASSSPAQGSTFSFSIQFDPAPANTQIVRIAPEEAPANRILPLGGKVADNLILRKMVPEPPSMVNANKNRQAAQFVAGISLWQLLIVDDSPDNRLLVQVYLRSGPYQLTFEEDGKAALDSFAIADFDLVLMDVQMPVMDGLEATRAIRTLERERGTAPTPILALTANGSPEDMEASADAGCNAHLTKPVSKLELLSAIEKYRRQTRPPEMPQSVPLEPILIAMPPGLEDVVPPYLARRRKEVVEMLELLAKSDLARLAVLGHDLKGSGGGYGLPELTRMGAALEQVAKGKEKDGESVSTLVAELSDYLDRVQLIART